MYIVPHSAPAASAAATPRIASFAGTCAAEAAASAVPPANISSAPPMTPNHRRESAPRSSLKKTTPQMIPSRLLLFQRGNAMLRPTSRTANIVSVLATAHRQPASTAHTIRCGACLRSAATYEVPCISAGIVQRARKTPITMLSEISTGDNPRVTSLVGASAAPSHAPAVTPHSMPTLWSVRSRRGSKPRPTTESRGAGPFGELKKSTAARGVPRSARRPEPRTADRAAPDSASYPSYRFRGSLLHLSVGAQYWEDWRLRARPASFQVSHLREAPVAAKEEWRKIVASSLDWEQAHASLESA